MKLKNKYTISFVHMLVMAAVIAVALVIVVGGAKLFIWSGANPGWLLAGFAVFGLWKIASDGVTDEDDWL